MTQLAEMPEIFVGVQRPPIDLYEKMVRAVTPGMWLYKGFIWEDGQPPEFGCTVEPANCGEREKEFSTGHVLCWNMGITACVEDRRTTDAIGGLPIPGNTIFTIEPITGLVTVSQDVHGEEVRNQVHAVRFQRSEDADFIREGRSIVNELLAYTRRLETYSTAKTNEVSQLSDQVSLLEAEVSRLRGLMLGDSDD